MKRFTKQQIVEFKSKKRYFITWKKTLRSDEIKDCFYRDETSNIKKIFPNENIRYCNCDNSIVKGKFCLGIKYTKRDENYYIFLSANSVWSPPKSIAIGKEEKGIIYLIKEKFPNGEFCATLIEIPKEKIESQENIFIQKSYLHDIFISPSHLDKSMLEIKDEDVKCLEIAYEGIEVFSELIKKSYN